MKKIFNTINSFRKEDIIPTIGGFLVVACGLMGFFILMNFIWFREEFNFTVLKIFLTLIVIIVFLKIIDEH